MKNTNDFEKYKQAVMEKIDCSGEIEDSKVYEWIDAVIMEAANEKYMRLEEKTSLRTRLFHSLRKLDILQELIDDPDITEIMINGTNNIFIEKNGQIEKCEKQFESAEKLEDVIQQMVAKANRIVNETTPIVDTRLENGSRVNIVLPPIALNGPAVTIRRFPDKPIVMKDLIRFGAISEDVSEFLKKLVKSKYNIIVCGGTGSGKTTFLNVLSNYIPCDERIITIEDSAELQILQIPNLVRMETRNANVEGCNQITIRDLIKTALRMRPNRIVIGEVRGSEAVDLIQCLNTGHEGSISTIHSNNSKDMISRLEMMVLMGVDIPLSAIKSQIAAGVDIIIHLGRMRDKSRKVLEITEIEGFRENQIILNPIYQYKETSKNMDKVLGKLVQCGELKNKEKLEREGFIL